MQSFTKKDIDKARVLFAKDCQLEQGLVGGYDFSYFVIPQSRNPILLNFALRYTGQPEDGYVIGVSDNLIEPWRPYVASHEYYEFMVVGISTKGRCVKSLEWELSQVPEEHKPDYSKMRARFFNDLIPYAKARPDFFTADDILEFKASKLYLEKN